MLRVSRSLNTLLPLQLPLTMPCLDFVLTWHTNPKKSPVVSFWKPLAPAGACLAAGWRLGTAATQGMCSTQDGRSALLLCLLCFILA